MKFDVRRLIAEAYQTVYGHPPTEEQVTRAMADAYRETSLGREEFAKLESPSFTRVDCRCAACHHEWSDASKACPRCFGTTITRKCGLKWSGAYMAMGEQEGRFLCQLPEGHSGTHTSRAVTWNAGPGEGVTATIHRVVEPVGVCDGSRMFAYDSRAQDGRGMRLPVTCPGCRACS